MIDFCLARFRNDTVSITILTRSNPGWFTMRTFRSLVVLVVLSSCTGFSQADRPPIREYIRDGWKTLSRSMAECRSVKDIKVAQTPVVYLPAGMPVPSALRSMQQRCKVKVAPLPHKIQQIGDMKPEEIKQHGLLYLPNRYVVPGGRFNEMYGWDSYFIILGLVRDGEQELARGMVENFFFEIEHYGAVLNANRTYFFTRSQPPLLTSMILAVSGSQNDPEWLRRAYGFAVRDHAIWDREPHVAGDTGLSRYYDFGEGPVPETADDQHYFAEVASAMLTREQSGREYLAFQTGDGTTGPEFEYQVCAKTRPAAKAKSCGPKQRVSLTRDYYKGDRSMRESGFDISFRFGPYSGSTHHFAPVCLNSLLYKYERDLEQIARQIGRNDEAQKWQQRAEERQKAIHKYLWNADKRMFFDYDLRSGKRSDYQFASTFYPLWAGLATPEQAAGVAGQLKIFERDGGVMTSDRETGMQWDAPYGWAPVQYFVVEGLKRYKFTDEAARVADKFAKVVETNYQRDGTIREKYNMITKSSETALTGGYKANVIGFGWTNGVYLGFVEPASKATNAK
jgi:alpha,alpha-trehalase